MIKKVVIALAITIIVVLVLFKFQQSTANNLVSPTSQNENQITEQQSQSPISIEFLRQKQIETSPLQIEEKLTPGSNFSRYIASYKSEGYTVYGLLTVPSSQPPAGGFPAIVFNHGYIPPTQYVTTEKYVEYVNALASNGFVVFKIDYRGNGNSEGQASGTYFSSSYTIDAISALKSLQSFDQVSPDRIGFWGHSMAGNLVLRSMEVSDQIKAGVIWAGAVYSYQDFAKYRISDNSYVRPSQPEQSQVEDPNRLNSGQLDILRSDPNTINFSDPLWTSISLTANLHYLTAPLQIHHAVNDSVVNIGYSRDLGSALKADQKTYEYYEYQGGGHNISDPYFTTAMQRTIDFFKKYL